MLWYCCCPSNEEYLNQPSAMKIFFFTIALLFAVPANAQCPYYTNCSIAAQIFCDYSTNDTLLWKSPPFTWHTGLMLSDLPEANVELGIVARDTCGGQDLEVGYTLFLDLDGNDTVETVVRSNAPPPSGKVLFNNIGSPNYALGDTIAFDHRTGLADSMRYRFVLELTRIADSVVASLKWTTGIATPTYSVPKLPLGKHRILWRVAQGGAEQFCEYAFEVKDCASPVVECVPNFSVNILPTGNITLWASDFVGNISDNITPENQLEIAVRAQTVNPGMGFPLDSLGNPNVSVTFDCCNLGANGIELWVRDKAGFVSQCTTTLIVQDGIGNCPSDGCGGNATIVAILKTSVANEWVEEASCELIAYYPFWLDTLVYYDNSWLDGQLAFHYLPTPLDFTLTPEKNDNPLNGVTTYDLVLISRHILAIEPLNSPYKIIAADASKNGSVTSFDIVEIRKLILGIYTDFPNNDSWRFVDEDFVFPNLQNPFQTTFPETISRLNWLGTPNSFNFISIKIGDVNDTAVPNATEPPPLESRAARLVAMPDRVLKAGEMLNVPISMLGQGDCSGLQFELAFDADLLELENLHSPRLPDFDQRNWTENSAGKVACSWSAASAMLFSPADELLTLRLKAKQDTRLSSGILGFDQSRIPAETYDSEGFAQSLSLVFSNAGMGGGNQIFDPQPNPATADVVLPALLGQRETLYFELFDSKGKCCWSGHWDLDSGSHALEIPANAMPRAGMYVWRVKLGSVIRSGKLVKL